MGVRKESERLEKPDPGGVLRCIENRHSGFPDSGGVDEWMGKFSVALVGGPRLPSTPLRQRSGITPGGAQAPHLVIEEF